MALKILPAIVALLFAANVFCQAQENRLVIGWIVKSNVFNLIAQRPTVSVEKFLSPTLSTEVSFVQGQFNNFLLTDLYHYNGFLVRVKKHFIPIKRNEVSPYAGLYLGNLKRTIQSSGHVDNSGWISYPSRDFSGNSIRGGATLGLNFFTRKRLNLDGQAGLGYGSYTKIYRPDIDRHTRGYLDVQLWFSVGYCF